MVTFRNYYDDLREALKDPNEALAYLRASLIENGKDGFVFALRKVAEANGIKEAK